MIEYFKVKNYKSYRDETVLSFVASRKESGPNNDLPLSWYKEIDGKRILKLLIGVGLNGAGKTKMLNAIEYLKEKATIKPQLPTIMPNYQPFLLDNESRDKNSEFELSYYIDETNFIYVLKISRDRIEEEELKIKGHGQKIYTRKYDKETETIRINFGSACDLNESDQHDLEINLWNNATVLATFGSLNLVSKLMKTNYDYFVNRLSIVHKANISMAEKLSTGDPERDAKIKELLTQLLKDVGSKIVDYRIEEVSINLNDLIKNETPDIVKNVLQQQYPNGNLKQKVVRFIHELQTELPKLKEDDPTEYQTVYRSLEFDPESDGTKQIIKLGLVLYDIAVGKKSACIDEFERLMHSKAVEFILKMYLSLAADRECQLFVATHDLILFDSKFIRQDAVRKFQKGPDGVTRILKKRYVHHTMNFLNSYNEELDEEIGREEDEATTLSFYQDF
ncbi:MAG: ATP-binding protein [Bacteroidales bacterium]|nr:ATP-binding protein [Bacteroidales bacterium]